MSVCEGSEGSILGCKPTTITQLNHPPRWDLATSYLRLIAPTMVGAGMSSGIQPEPLSLPIAPPDFQKGKKGRKNRSKIIS